ncbi:MAG: threonine/serine dehydratase [Candidatus Dormibacteraeota bacterium]|nr:threonine/serine dehydratase [Candidatus Dormibacteraeota bacterium]
MIHQPIPLAEIQAAKRRIAGSAVRTPLVRLNLDDAPAEIYLKLENLQPIGSFKIRGAVNLLAQLDPAQLVDGVWTASAGNMAQALAWCARQRGISCAVVVPETAPEAKLSAVRRFGADIVTVSPEEFFETFSSRHKEGMRGLFVHAFSDGRMMAGNGTIALEILEDLPQVDAILVPYGGGGLTCGIACAAQAIAPKVKVFACEPDSAKPLDHSLAAGRPVAPPFQRTFIDGAGGPRVYPEMFELAQRLQVASLPVPVEKVAEAVRLLVERNHVVAEGAGALPVAAALSGGAGTGRVCCVVSGGNIDTHVLTSILRGEILESS